ncbi:MAG: hypothetical protein LW823_02625 [Rickettsiales bacterium]|jgi:hypothetical protein|nr:hypothetical protein [Rickettsiales bacterium]
MKAFFGSDGALQVVAVSGAIEANSPAANLVTEAIQQTSSRNFSDLSSGDLSSIVTLPAASSHLSLPMSPNPQGRGR